MPIDNATASFLAGMQQVGGPPLEEMTPTEARALGPMLAAMYGKGPQIRSVEQQRVATAVGEIEVRVFTPDTEPVGIIVYLHGGGWVLGSLDEYDTLARHLATATSCTVVVPDYPLAPENPYPAPLLGARGAVEWAARNTAVLAGPDAPLILMGDSAGGNLAAVIAQQSRADGPRINLQVLIYPVTDSDFATESYLNPENQLMLTAPGMRWFWDQYAPDTALRDRPDLSPLRADELAGSPPAVILTAEYDALRDEGEAYAARLQAAGIPVIHRRFAGQMHMFFTLVNVLPAAAEAMAWVADEVRVTVSAGTRPPT